MAVKFAILGRSGPQKMGQMRQKDVIFQKRTGEVLWNQYSHPKMGQNEPKNEAEKLLETKECIKNEPERTGKRTGEVL